MLQRVILNLFESWFLYVVNLNSDAAYIHIFTQKQQRRSDVFNAPVSDTVSYLRCIWLKNKHHATEKKHYESSHSGDTSNINGICITFFNHMWKGFSTDLKKWT